MDWFKIAGLAIPIIGGFIAGVFFVSDLKNRVSILDDKINGINIGTIRDAEKETAKRLKNLVKKPTLVKKTFNWVKGNPEVEMIGINEGFCYLSNVSGKFDGVGESVWIQIRGDFWYLGGLSVLGKDVAASARCWKWPTVSDK